MTSIFCVGAGGFLGAVFRYLVGLAIPANNISLPVSTLLINVIGAFAIGFISGMIGNRTDFNSNLGLFLTVGVCGGFTTFSTFSLEVLTLMEGGKPAMGFIYAFLSFAFCVAGVILGRLLERVCAV